MKKLLIFCFQILLASAVFGQGIQFESEGTTLAEVRAKAQQTGKMLFVAAYSSSCHVCEHVLTKTFPQEAVGQFFNPNFVNFKIDVDNGEGIEFGNEHVIIAFPTFLFFDETGKLLHRSQGSVDAEKMLQIGTDALRPDGQFFTLLDRYHNGDRTPQLLKKLTLLAKDLEDTELLQTVHYEYLQTQTDWLEKDNMDIIVKCLRSIEQPTLPFLLENLAAFEASLGMGEVHALLDRAILNSLSMKAYNRELRRFDMDMARNFGAQHLPPALLEQSLSVFAMNQCLLDEDVPAFLASAEKHFDTYPCHNAQMLNNIALRVYEHTDDPALLVKAAAWSERAVALKDTYRHNDVAAAIFFKIGQLEKAAGFAEKAIRLGNEWGNDVSQTVALLESIRSKN